MDDIDETLKLFDKLGNVGLNGDWSCSAIFASPGIANTEQRGMYVLDNIDLSSGDGPAFLFVERVCEDEDNDEVIDVGFTSDIALVEALVLKLREEADPDVRVAMVREALGL